MAKRVIFIGQTTGNELDVKLNLEKNRVEVSIANPVKTTATVGPIMADLDHEEATLLVKILNAALKEMKGNTPKAPVKAEKPEAEKAPVSTEASQNQSGQDSTAGSVGDSMQNY